MFRVINPEKLKDGDENVIWRLWEKNRKPFKKDISYSLLDDIGFTFRRYKFTKNTNVIEIDPLKPTANQKKILFSFLFSEEFKGNCKKDSLYHFSSDDKNTAIFICFTHDLIYRRCNSLGKYSGDIRYEVLSNQNVVGSGTFGKVIESVCTLSPNDKNQRIDCKFKLFGERRVVKIIKAEDEKAIREINNEYQVSLLAGHLHVKEPYFSQKQAFMTMRKMEGETLFDVIKNDKNGIAKLTLDQRIELSIAVLQALDRQVHAKKIIHRDIKPNNIMVYQVDDQFFVNIIDYGLSETFDQNNDVAEIGRFPYIAPELRPVLLEINSYRADIYSVARVISQLYGFPIISTNFGQNRDCTAKKLWDEYKKGFYLEGLFDGITDISEDEKNNIFTILSNLGHPNLAERWSIKKGLEEFGKMKTQRQVVQVIDEEKTSCLKYFSF